MAENRLLPYGVKDYYPQEVERLNSILSEAQRELTLWGYREIKFPTLEYKKLFENTLGESLKDGFLLKECEKGEILALRYDFTPQIVRFVLHSKERIFPLRVYYKGETFRSDRQLWEEVELGFELVGADTVEADAEILAIVTGILKRLGIKEYTLVVGHRLAYESLVERFGKPAVDKKRFSPPLKDFLKTYPLTGEGWQRLSLPQRVKEELLALLGLLKTYQLAEENILFSPSLKPEREYHSGLYFRVIGKSGTLAVGGRYNRLFERFGENIPAVGGGLKINNLLEVVPKRESSPRRVYIIDTEPSKGEGWKLAKLLRERGIIAERDIVTRDPQRSVKVAKEKGYEEIIVIGKEIEGTIGAEEFLKRLGG